MRFHIIEKKDDFELERIYNTLNLMNLSDIDLCFNLYTWNNEDAKDIVLGTHNNVIQCWKNFRNEESIESMRHLINLGILIESSKSYNSFILSKFGKHFINVLNNSH